LGVVGFEFDSAVDVVVIEGFVEISAVAEGAEGRVQLSIYRCWGSLGSEKRFMEGR
jgi:hypothetical protein